MAQAKDDIRALVARLDALESERAVRACMNRYMALCDDLDEGFDLAPLMDLFTEDAVWEGAGRYAATFGRQEGRDAVRAMFAKYTAPPAHFRLNVHFLTSETIAVDGDDADGQWVLLQTSTFASGASQLSAAKISARFRRGDDGTWRIRHFQTRRQFSRPVSTPWESEGDLPVPE